MIKSHQNYTFFYKISNFFIYNDIWIQIIPFDFYSPQFIFPTLTNCDQLVVNKHSTYLKPQIIVYNIHSKLTPLNLKFRGGGCWEGSSELTFRSTSSSCLKSNWGLVAFTYSRLRDILRFINNKKCSQIICYKLRQYVILIVKVLFYFDILINWSSWKLKMFISKVFIVCGKFLIIFQKVYTTYILNIYSIAIWMEFRINNIFWNLCLAWYMQNKNDNLCGLMTQN